MAEFLTTSGVSSNLEKIVGGAQKRLVLISPYLQFPAILFERLQQADRRGVQIVFIYGKEELKDEQQSKLKQLRNLSLYFYENLHAKCYLNESDMIITSMNLVEYSEKNNREMGILLHRSGDADRSIFDAAVQETQSILSSAIKHGLQKTGKEPAHFERRTKGSCIGCGEEIPLDIDKPYCYECYSEWQDLDDGDPDCEERFCHICGKKASTSKSKPLCRSCYNKSQN